MVVQTTVQVFYSHSPIPIGAESFLQNSSVPASGHFKRYLPFRRNAILILPGGLLYIIEALRNNSYDNKKALPMVLIIFPSVMLFCYLFYSASAVGAGVSVASASPFTSVSYAVNISFTVILFTRNTLFPTTAA